MDLLNTEYTCSAKALTWRHSSRGEDEISQKLCEKDILAQNQHKNSPWKFFGFIIQRA